MKIAVLVDLKLSKHSGGHVKYWERLSEALTNLNHDLKLTIFFLGEEKKVVKKNKHVDYFINKPLISSKVLKKIGIDADDTDLSPLNPFLFFHLKKFDLIHTTDQFFSMASTARLAAKFWSIPLTTSIHTDTPPYTKYYIDKVVNNLFSKYNTFNLLSKKNKISNFFERRMYKKIYSYIKCVDHAMVADQIYSPDSLLRKTGNQNITKLHRGIDKKVFNFNNIAKKNVLKKYKIEKDEKIIFFSGRIHELKGAIHLAKVHAKLISQGFKVTTLLAGERIHARECQEIAPNKLHILGYLQKHEIADLYRICDLFVFPSQFEIGPNVVIEAKACGAVCVVSPNGGGKRIYSPGNDGIIVKNMSTKLWADVINKLLSDPVEIKRIKSFIKNQKIKSWKEIYCDDLMPYWKKIVTLKNEKDIIINTSS